MKRITAFFKKRKEAKKVQPVHKREDLEKKVVEGAEKALKEYRRVFERLAEYDRT